MALLVESGQMQYLVPQDWLQTEGYKRGGQVGIDVVLLHCLEVVVGQFNSRKECKAGKEGKSEPSEPQTAQRVLVQTLVLSLDRG